jgi:prepilin-type N-terminal cleavage/methylation domain-containing protein
MTRAKPGESGLTLIELLLAITIFALVIGTIYGSLSAATRALAVGKEGMELYQTTRAGMNRLMTELRRSLAPGAFPFEEKDEMERKMDEGFLGEEEEESQFQVTFVGDAHQVRFVVHQELKGEKGPTMDMREVVFRTDEQGRLVKEIDRSLLVARLQESVLRRRMKNLQEDDRRRERSSRTQDQLGYLEKPILQILCEGILDLRFSYFDGESWRDSWDSEERVLSPYSREIPEEELGEEDEEKIGLPRLVKVDMTIAKDIVLSSCTDIPGADLNLLGSRSNESDFGSAYHSSHQRTKRLRERSSKRG